MDRPYWVFGCNYNCIGICPCPPIFNSFCNLTCKIKKIVAVLQILFLMFVFLIGIFFGGEDFFTSFYYFVLISFVLRKKVPDKILKVASVVDHCQVLHSSWHFFLSLERKHSRKIKIKRYKTKPSDDIIKKYKISSKAYKIVFQNL